MTQPPWPVDKKGRPLPVDKRSGAPDFEKARWPQQNGQWSPVRPDGRPAWKGDWTAMHPWRWAAVCIAILALVIFVLSI